MILRRYKQKPAAPVREQEVRQEPKQEVKQAPKKRQHEKSNKNQEA